jgi:hypothetical protein
LLAGLIFADFYDCYSNFHKGRENPRVVHGDKRDIIKTYYQTATAQGPLRFTQRVDEQHSRQLLFYYNTPLFFPGLETPRGYMDFGPAYADSLGQVTNTAVRLDLQNVGLILNQERLTGHLSLLPRPGALKRVSFYSNVVVFTNDTELARELDTGRLDYRTVLALAEAPPGVMVGSKQPESPHRLYLDRRSPEEYRIHYTTTVPGVIFISESHYPGWEALDDRGRQLPIIRAFLAFKGVVVAEPGSGTITLRFRPRVFRIGATVTVTGLVLLAGLGIWCARRGCRLWP